MIACLSNLSPEYSSTQTGTAFTIPVALREGERDFSRHFCSCEQVRARWYRRLTSNLFCSGIAIRGSLSTNANCRIASILRKRLQPVWVSD